MINLAFLVNKHTFTSPPSWYSFQSSPLSLYDIVKNFTKAFLGMYFVLKQVLFRVVLTVKLSMSMFASTEEFCIAALFASVMFPEELLAKVMLFASKEEFCPAVLFNSVIFSEELLAKVMLSASTEGFCPAILLELLAIVTFSAREELIDPISFAKELL